MLESGTRLRPNTGDVAAKVIDGEAIIMNLANGLYFSMDEVGSAVWEMVEVGRSLDEMAAGLEARFEVDRPTVEADVTRLAGELLAENLVVVSDTPPADSTAPASSGQRSAYAAPTLSKYDDMADLLALDPPMPGIGNLPAE
jgi:hypothetical protein